MSAIAGILNLDGRPVEEADLAKMIAVLAAHGRDGQGTWAHGPVGLGHRLMIVTPEDRGEQQPVTAPAAGYVLVTDARIDNRDDLARTLDIPGHEAGDLPDSAFILAAYGKWGERCAEHLLGDFAFALWDPQKRRLLLSRDQLGNRVIFYHRSEALFAFATFPSALFALPPIPQRLSVAELGAHLGRVRSSELGASYFEGIRRVPAAHFLTASTNGIKVSRYWSVDDVPEIRLSSDRAYVDAFGELFDQAVRCRLRSVHPVGAFLSGGLDSTSIVAVAAEQLTARGRRLAAFSAVPPLGFARSPDRPGWEADETPYIRAVADWTGNVDLELIRPESTSLLDGLDESHRALASPVRAAFNRVWTDAISQTAQERRIGVLLDGWGGNLTMSWSGDRLFEVLARQGRWWRLLREAHSASRATAVPMWRVLGSGLTPLLPNAALGPLWRSKDEGRAPWVATSMMNPRLAADLSISDRIWQDRLAGSPRSTRTSMFSGAGRNSADYQNAQRALFGVESRFPAVDLKVLEFCVAIPESQFRHDGVGRLLIRRALRGKLPPPVLWRQSRGDQQPDWRERLSATHPLLEALVSRLECSQLAQRCLDLPRLRHALLPGFADRTGIDSRVQAHVLMRTLMAGHFILTWEEAARNAG